MTRTHALASVVAAAAAATIANAHGAGTEVDGWPFYGHDAGGMRFSPLTQVTRDNVGRLKIAWTFHTGDIADGHDGGNRSGFETTPLVVDGTLYLTTGFNRVIALDPETGVQKWAFDPLIERHGDYGDGFVNRGLAAWEDAAPSGGSGGAAPGAGATARVTPPCRKRLFEATQDARLIALDAATGARCSAFGEHGQISLRQIPGYQSGWYHMTSPLTYQMRPGGKQYVVVAAGGHPKITEERLGDALVAFALDQ